MYSIVKFEDQNDNREILAHGWAKKDDNSPAIYIFQRCNKDRVISTFVDGKACEGEFDSNDMFDIKITIHGIDYEFDQGTASWAENWSVSEVKVGNLTPHLTERPYVGEITAVKITTKKPGFLKRIAKKVTQAIVR